MTSDDDQGIGGFLREFRRSMLMDASKKLAWWILVSILGGLALLVWKGGSLPAWTVLLAVVLTGAAGVWWRGRTKRLLMNDVLELAEERNEVSEDVQVLSFGLERHESYSKHVAQSLDALQRVVSGDIEVPIPHYIEQAILEPARDLLMEKPAEDIRLSVLLPDDDQENWWMAWAAGHSLAGKAKYNQRIVDTLSRHAYETAKPYYWPDVTADSGYQANPKASRPIRTMLSLPVRSGDTALGVFNIVSSEPEAFDLAEQTYIASLGGVLSVAVGVYVEQLNNAENE